MTLRIYKIVDDTNGNCYIGSTTKTLRERLKEHEYNMIRWMEGRYCWVTSFEILNNNDYHIELVEEIEQYEDRNHIEGRYIREAQNCVNKKVMGRSQEETYQLRKQKVECECGGCYTLRHKAKHLKTKKHLDYINNQ